MISKMFTSLKNKIKEETGNEVPRRFPPHPAQTPRHHASNSSLGSTVSGDVDGNFLISSDTLHEYSAREKDLAVRLEKAEREYARRLEERDREWQEKVTSLQNNMQAAQEVWCGEAAAARRECREEVRRSAARAEQLLAATNAAARAQDRLDQALEEIEAERRGWAQERLRLAAQAEEALHNLSLAEPLHPTQDESCADGMTSNELALKRKLEEAQLHLHDIKTSWSGQIAALETQVGRLSRQAGEEGAERRRVEKERDSLLQRLREKEIQLEQAQATLEDKEAKMALLAAEAGEAARSGRVARTEAQEHRHVADTLSSKLFDAEKQLAASQERWDCLNSENITFRNSLEQEKKKVDDLKKEVDSLSIEKSEWVNRERVLKEEIQQNIIHLKSCQGALESEKLRHCEALKDVEILKDQVENLKHELNEIHERYDKERRDKDESLMRNAHMSQTLEIYRQEMRQQETEIVDLKGKVKQLENTLSQSLEEQCTIKKLQNAERQNQVDLENIIHERDTAIASEKHLQDCVKDLNVQLSEKVKNIRVLQNRLTDMKKTLQRELRGGQVDPLGSSVVEGSTEDPDVTKKYLKHVLIKFLTSREMEARQLTRAVAALLGLTQQEEAQLRDTLAWRGGLSAWLAPHPRLSYT